MTDRVQSLGEAPRACPFVAFDDDRDRRADEPDHRHRCYAEPTPAPRAVAHQRTYCLSSAFATCPIFLDWAVRAAADPVAVAPRPAEVEPVLAAARPSDASSTGGRAEHGEWADPPPWMAVPGTPAPAAVGGRAASGEVDRIPSDPEPVGIDAGGADQAPDEEALLIAATTPRAGTPDVLDGQEGTDAWTLDARGAQPDSDPDATLPPFLAGRRERATSPIAAGSLPPRAPSQPTPAPPTRPIRPVSDFPDWERPRRFEAYPTLRTRVGMRSVSPVLLGAIALILAAALLFLLPGFLSERPPGVGGPGASPTSEATPTASPEPTPTPAPTPVSYTVRSGDTLSRIAKRFGLTIDQIVCFNELANPDRLEIGQVLLIPDDEFECPVDAAPTRRP